MISMPVIETQIAASMNRPVNPGAATVNDVIAMTHAGVDENLIVNHVTGNGLVRPLQSNDVIYLQQNGVSPRVIATMQAARVPVAAAPPGAVVMPGGPPPVVMADPYYGGYWGPHYYRPYYGPSVGGVVLVRQGTIIPNSNSRLEFSCRPSPAVIAGSIMTLPYVDGFFTTVRPLEFATPNRAILAGDCDFGLGLVVIGYLQIVRVVDNGTSNGFTDIANLSRSFC